MKAILLFVAILIAVYAQSPSKVAYKELTDETFENATKKAAVIIFYNPYNYIKMHYKYIIDGVQPINELLLMLTVLLKKSVIK